MLTKEKIISNLNKDPLFYTKNVVIETTNRCNYAPFHPRCPLHYIKEKKILPLVLIENILKEIGEYNFSGVIYPFNYGEPNIDPRFFHILTLIKKYVPQAKIWIYSNGFMVDDTLLKELDSFGLDRLNFSAYTPEEGKYIHLMILRLRDSVKMTLRAYRRYPMDECMNDKVQWYDNEPLNLNLPCTAPLKFLTINSYGDVGLCCHDWKRIQTFGNVAEKSLVEIIRSDKIIDVFYNLLKGERYRYQLCARCWKQRK